LCSIIDSPWLDVGSREPACRSLNQFWKFDAAPELKIVADWSAESRIALFENE
jgi:hypothetical protein